MKSEDIAKICGVSRSTVSRVINNYDNVPPETREKVMKVISEYQYKPNSFARSLAGKKNETIGIFVLISGNEKYKLYQNDYFTNLLELIIEIANEHNYFSLVSLISTDEDYAKINKAIVESRIDGGIIIGTNKDIFEHLYLNNVKSSLVLFDYDFSDETLKAYNNLNLSSININDVLGIEKAITYLYDLGHKDIGFITGNNTSRSGIARYKAYKEIMKKFNLNIVPEWIIKGDFEGDIAYKNSLKSLNSEKFPTAYISSNDYMAFALIKALEEKKLNVPNDVSVVGFDGTQKAKDSTPSLTTLQPDYFNMALQAVETLIAMINGEEFKQNNEFNVELIVRKSCS